MRVMVKEGKDENEGEGEMRKLCLGTNMHKLR